MKWIQLLVLLLAIVCDGASFHGSFDWGLHQLKLKMADESGLHIEDIGTAVDAKNYYYVSGHFGLSAEFGTNTLSSTNLANAYLAKYDSHQNCIWARQINNAVAPSVATGPSGGVFLTGQIKGDTVFGTTPVKCRGKRDIFLAKYDSDGNLLWDKHVDGPGLQRGEAVAADATGNSYITGELWGDATFDDVHLVPNGRCDLFVAKYGPEGKLLWVKRNEGFFTQARGIAVDTAGNAYVTGYFEGLTKFESRTLTAKGGATMFLVKFDHDGNFLWVRSPAGEPPAHFSGGTKVALDVFDNPLVAGSMQGPLVFGSTNLVLINKPMPYDRNGFLVKYSAAGDFEWVRQFRRSDFDLSNVVNVEASGVIFDRTGARPQSDLHTLPPALDSDSVKAALLRGKKPIMTPSDHRSLLNLEKSGSFIVLFWAKDLGKVILEGSETISPFPVWEDIRATAEVFGDQKVVVIPVSIALRFYRLRRS